MTRSSLRHLLWIMPFCKGLMRSGSFAPCRVRLYIVPSCIRLFVPTYICIERFRLMVLQDNDALTKWWLTNLDTPFMFEFLLTSVRQWLGSRGTCIKRGIMLKSSISAYLSNLIEIGSAVTCGVIQLQATQTTNFPI